MAIALITGTSTGIGLATAVTLARGGHTVIATMRNPQGGAAEIRRIAEAEKLPITVLSMDVDDDASVRESVAQALAQSGRIDVLVNNAGVAVHGSVEELPLAEFRRAMETNFFGALRCIQAVVPGMRERRHGCIVNVSSVAGRFSAAPQAAYSASKWALEAASEALAQEMKAFGVRVAIVEPGIIATPIFGKVTPGTKPSRYPHARRLAALFAASLKNPGRLTWWGKPFAVLRRAKAGNCATPLGRTRRRCWPGARPPATKTGSTQRRSAMRSGWRESNAVAV